MAATKRGGPPGVSHAKKEGVPRGHQVRHLVEPVVSTAIKNLDLRVLGPEAMTMTI
jgi:hypothetical protein